MKGHPIVFAFCWLMLAVSGWAQQLVFTRANHSTNNIVIPAGEVWKIVGWKTTGLPAHGGTDVGYFFEDLENKYFQVAGGFSLFGTGGLSTSSEFFFSLAAAKSDELYLQTTPRPPIGAFLVGPQTLAAETAVLNTTNGYTLVLEKVSGGRSSHASSTSVVIPATASAEVDIKIEQSTDNVTWTECLPGTYNSSTVKRFFRLRAVER